MLLLLLLTLWCFGVRNIYIINHTVAASDMGLEAMAITTAMLKRLQTGKSRTSRLISAGTSTHARTHARTYAHIRTHDHPRAGTHTHTYAHIRTHDHPRARTHTRTWRVHD